MLWSSEILLSAVIAAATWLSAPAEAGTAKAPRPAAVRAAVAKTPARPASYVRTRGDGFEIVGRGGTRPFHVRGVNLGAGAPGRFPGEFAFTKEEYRRFLRAARDLHANAIRVYALHPPSFYQALREENEARPDAPLWLFQEVWTELPESNDFWDPAFSVGFERDVRVAIEAIHGDALLPPRPGHASGRYDADVSPWLAGWLLGREWEPYAVRVTEGRHPDSTRYRGRHFAVDRGTPMEVWLARQCDLAVHHERTRYGVAHAVSFVNWPTLDVMKHPTESERGGRESEHDEDAYAVDPARIRPLAEAGLEQGFLGYFANYHVYPYYPDFINLDPGYAATRDRHGACNYAGYLRDLKAHTRGLPLVIGEFGVPTSRGIAHRQPQGIDHGGASERAQGAQDVRLLEDIEESGAAGSLLFALFDEWFKVNWLVWNAERPRDRDPLWHNLLDPEESYGLIAFDPPPRIRIDGDPSDWNAIAPYATAPAPAPAAGAPRRAARGGGFGAPIRAIYVTSDQARLYLRLDVEPAALRGGRPALGVSLDVLDPKRGDVRLPPPLDATWSRGAEFALVIDPGRDGRNARAELFADRSMNWSKWSRLRSGEGFRVHRAPFRPVANEDGLYAPLLIETNRERVSRTGVVYRALHLDWGRLSLGPAGGRRGADGPDPYDPGSDWSIDRERGVIEVALPWGLLNVGDPSSRAVLDDAPKTDEVETTRTAGIGLLAWATSAPGVAADSLGPARAGSRLARPDECQFVGAPGMRQVVDGHRVRLLDPGTSSYLWNAWETPITTERLKRSAEYVRRHFEGMESRESESNRKLDALR